MAVVEDGTRDRWRFWRSWRSIGGKAGKGACVIGTVIGVQVSSCAWVLEMVGA